MTTSYRMTEADLQAVVTDALEALGWEWVHIRAGMTAAGQWRTPVSGPLGKGWPDVLAVRQRDRRLVLLELKSDAGRLSDAQTRIHAVLRAAGLDVRVVRPGGLDELLEAIR